MNEFKAACLTISLFSVMSADTARAAIIYSQPPDSPFGGQTSQFLPDVGTFGFNTFDNFTLSVSEGITGLTWQGTYFDALNLQNNPAAANSTGFGVQFFANAGGVPGVLLAGAIFDIGSVNETFAGTQSPFADLPITVPFYNYNLTFASPFEATAGVPYWLRIFAVSPPPAPGVAQWAWNSSFAGDQLSLQFNGFDPNFIAVIPRDRAFDLVASPEPGSLLIFLATGSLAGLGFLRVRRNRASGGGIGKQFDADGYPS